VRDFLRSGGFDVIVHAATTRSNRSLGAPADMLDRNCRMFFNLARNQPLFGKMLHFGSGAEYSRECLPARVSENYFDTRVPRDAYGFSKYICREVRFVSNACARVVKGLPIVIRQNVVFDYLYVEELAKLTAWFIENEPRQKTYNVCRGRTFALLELARMVAAVSGRSPEIMVRDQGLGPEYSGDNTRMLDEIGGYQFREMSECVRELYEWYAAHADEIDATQLKFDE
jgi:GDP-L-fucose synthase